MGDEMSKKKELLDKLFKKPHPGNELYKYQLEKIRQFIIEIGEKT